MEKGPWTYRTGSCKEGVETQRPHSCARSTWPTGEQGGGTRTAGPRMVQIQAPHYELAISRGLSGRWDCGKGAEGREDPRDASLEAGISPPPPLYNQRGVRTPQPLLLAARVAPPTRQGEMQPPAQGGDAAPLRPVPRRQMPVIREVRALREARKVFKGLDPPSLIP